MHAIRRAALSIASGCCLIGLLPANGWAVAAGPAPEPTALNRYYDQYTSFLDHQSTTRVLSPPSGFEHTLAYVVRRGSGAAGLTPVRNCTYNATAGDHHLETGAAACDVGDQRVVSEEGDIFTSVPGGGASHVAIYSCFNVFAPPDEDVFESMLANCEGHPNLGLLGYGLTYVPDSTAPVCSGFVVRRARDPFPDQADVTVTDSDSGLLEITNADVVNGSVTVPTFVPGTRTGQTVTVTKATKGTLTRFSLDVTDIATNIDNCR
ncbi:hypothetical protein [Paraconexibacter sp.]|uniref:hypothetical protein n=1 Tax=Paraconexibacter sp. TaxID=2949640 RepID=UPI00356B418B